jgi:hypothetical protein
MLNPIGNSQSSNAQQQTSTTHAKAEPNQQHALPEDTVNLFSARPDSAAAGSKNK